MEECFLFQLIPPPSALPKGTQRTQGCCVGICFTSSIHEVLLQDRVSRAAMGFNPAPFGTANPFHPLLIVHDHPAGPCTVLQPCRQTGMALRQIFIPQNSHSICPAGPAALMQPIQPTPPFLPPQPCLQEAMPGPGLAHTSPSPSLNQPHHIVQEQRAPLMHYWAANTAFSQL